VTRRLAQKFNLSVASNVLRQMDVKIGANLYYMMFTKEVGSGVMLIGIDVSHAGSNSSCVGFCATINKNLSQYYSNVIIQEKRKEIVDQQLSETFGNALEAYREHNGNYPSHIILYRDGVGDSQRRDVLQKEVSQFHEAIDRVYNKAEQKPFITVVIVNKRIN
jgi:aubergine